MKAVVPLSPDDLGGPFISLDEGCFRILADKGKALLIEFHALPPSVAWFRESEFMYCQRQHDPQSVEVIRKATAGGYRAYRVPIWIQGEDTPECCGRPMFFVGQIDDDVICTERPPGAKCWWHDAASFYVFTCSQCLAVKAVGQQF